MDMEESKQAVRRSQYRSYYWRNKETISQKLKSKRDANPESEKLRNAENYRKNKDRILAYKKAYRDRNREKLNEQARQKRKITPKQSGYMAKYGVNEAWYLEQLEKQGGACAICKKPHTQNKRRLAIDHCHKTGSVRALLCDLCNKGLGHFEDNKSFLYSAILYLETHENKPDKVIAKSIAKAMSTRSGR
jgi:DNA repair exonuclease SbcCD ATPase subunit